MSDEGIRILLDAELVLLGCIKDGDASYEEAVDNYLRSHPDLYSNVSSKRAEALLVFCHLAFRGAVAAGLSVASAFTICEQYLSDIGHVSSFEDAADIVLKITKAYVSRVHKLREIGRVSDNIQRCIEYIDNNLCKKIRAADLAALTGTKEYSLTRRFSLETGVTVNDYVKNARIARAKIYLSGTDTPIQEIAVSLGFSTAGYFSTCFKQIVGISPDLYRAENRGKI